MTQLGYKVALLMLGCAWALIGCQEAANTPRRLVTSPPPAVDPAAAAGYEVEIIADTVSVDYAGSFCQLKQGTKIKILDFSEDGDQYTRFKLPVPVPGCGDKLFLTVLTDKVKLDMPKAAGGAMAPGGDVTFKDVEDSFDPHRGDWVSVVKPKDRPVPPAAPMHRRPFVFPLRTKSMYSYVGQGRGFGALRNWGRLHAGVDLLADPRTEVRAVADGTILQYYEFYEGTYALEVDHKNFLVRYCEVFARGDQKPGGRVAAGEAIAEVGLMRSGSSMLHFEMYKGSEQGALTQGANQPYQRRQDLVNPTRFIQELELRVP